MSTAAAPGRLSRTFRPVFSGIADFVASLVSDRRRPEGMAFFAATGVTEVSRLVGSDRLEHFSKPLIAPAATAVALRPGLPAPVDTALVGLAGAGYTAGDVVLMLGTSEKRDAGRLVRGAAAFGVGHLAIVASLLRNGIRPAPLPMALHLVPGIAAAAKLATASNPAERPLAAYALVLSGTAGLAASAGFEARPPHDGAPGDTAARRTLGLGGAIFMLSDLLILVRKKVGGRSEVANRALSVAVIDTYAMGSLFLLAGTAAVARAGEK